MGVDLLLCKDVEIDQAACYWPFELVMKPDVSEHACQQSRLWCLPRTRGRPRAAGTDHGRGAPEVVPKVTAERAHASSPRLGRLAGKKCDGAEAWQAASECAAARTALESPLDLPEIRYAPSAFVDDGALHAVGGAGGGDGGGNGRRTSTDTSPLSSS